MQKFIGKVKGALNKNKQQPTEQQPPSVPAQALAATDGAPAGQNASEQNNVQQKATNTNQQQTLAAATQSGQLTIALENQTSSSTVYAYVTGRDPNQASSPPILLQSDGHTIYTPSNVSTVGSPLAQDIAIRLGAPGSTTNVTIPYMAGGRIYFSVDQPLTFYLNPGPALVEPSVTNTSDPNYNVDWSFSEFTFNSAQVFANISYVDHVGVPIALTLANTSGGSQHVSGMPANGRQQVADQLNAQTAADGQPWNQLIYAPSGSPLRIISPNLLYVTSSGPFGTYYDPYVQQVWQKFSSQNLTVNTQASFGNLTGTVSNGTLNIDGAGSFNQPSTQDVFSCNSGPFATGSDAARNTVIPRLAAAFNRSTLLQTDTFPDGSSPANYYQETITNHYSRIVHSVNLDGRGYAFPYDDVVPDGGSDVAGVVFDGSPSLFTVTVGGNNAYA